MATAKVFLDTRYKGRVEDGKEKPCSIKISVNHRGTASNILLDIKVLESQWNAKERRVKNHPQKAMLNMAISEQIAIVERVLLQLTQCGEAQQMSCTELCKAVKARLSDKPQEEQPKVKNTRKPQSDPNTLQKLFHRYMENHDLSNGTLAIYEITMRKLEKYLGRRWSTFSVKEVNYAWIEDFEKFLATTAPSANARGITLRNLKAVCRYAYKLEIIQRDPFINFTIKTQKTAKRNMDVDALRRIIFAELEPWMEIYRDFFVLGFMLRGLNTVDLCHIGKPKKGRIEWVRTKTGQPLSFKVEPEMLPYIDRWQGTTQLLKHCENGRKYKAFANQLSKGLRSMVQYINYRYRDNIKVPQISMYWGRHTWATIASNLDIPVDLVAAGLGHSPKGVTEIYIERDPSRVDRANRKVLDWVLYGKRTNGDPITRVDEREMKNELPDAYFAPPKEGKQKHGRPKDEWRV